uniref:Uncharacterized protein n=1 Tax=Reoviridae sp. BF02/7/10 TaxID=2511768 RepID=A0A411DB93_9REOV|nr:hypothetical protein [Reoviridae sp. BF02/7/10]
MNSEKRVTSSDVGKDDIELKITRLKMELLELEKQLADRGLNILTSSQDGIETNAKVLVVAQEVQRSEKENHDKLVNMVASIGPKMTNVARPSFHVGSFSSPLAIKRISVIPSLFQVEILGKSQSDVTGVLGTRLPLYLLKSARDFGFGITEARFIMKSTGFDHDIDFSPADRTKILTNVINPTPGPVTMDSSKNDYVLKICETLFLIYLNSQFVLTGVEFTTKFDRTEFAGDFVSTFGMIRNQYVDQEVPLLPAAAFGNPARYINEVIQQMFQPVHHHMVIGERGRDTISQKKVFRRTGVITDQFTAALNEIYLSYLSARSIDHNSYVAQHKVLTFRNVSIRVEKPSMFNNTLIPMWHRSECDGALLIYALDTNRQCKYIHHLSQLLMSTNLLSFATIEEVNDLPPRKNLHDQEIQQLLDNVLNAMTSHDFYRALSFDLSTTWVDVNLVTSYAETGPLHAVFKVFNVLLWYAYFPSISRDNAPKIMFELFTALEVLAENETDEYVRNIGFSTYSGRTATIQEYPKELYYNGTVSFPLLEKSPTKRYHIFNTIHELITHDYGNVLNTMDSDMIQTPRMDDVRVYYQPYNHCTAVSNNIIDGEIPNDFANRLKLIKRLIIELIQLYKRKYRDFSSRAAFGNTIVSTTALLSFFNDFTPSLLSAIGIRSHAEIFILRELAANSPYILDCQNLRAKAYLLRPQVLVQTDDRIWIPLQMQRYCENLPFELPLYTFLSLRGAESIHAITPPDAATQYANLECIQEEGILCGDLIKFVNNLKFGNVGLFNREALGISSIITAARADKIFCHLSELSALNNFKDLFEILIEDVATRIDSRAIGFKICLQVYGSTEFNSRVPQPERSLYGNELRLGRKLMDEIMATVSPLFVPETSPIALYTEGLFVYYNYHRELDPFSFVPLEQIMGLVKRVVMWSPSIIGRRVKEGSRFIDEDILRFPDEYGEIHEYVLSDDMPLTLIILTASTGQISPLDFTKLRRFFTEKKIAFLLPELMVIMNREIVSQTVEEDILLHHQLQEVLTGLPNRRLTLLFGDTIAKAYRLTNTTEKLKFLYPITPISQRDVILRGMTDQIEKPEEFQIGSWMSWAFGGLDGKSIILHESEELSNPHNAIEVNQNSERVINKLSLGMVNFNNEVRILMSDDFIKKPSIEQDISRAYVDIYST